jgi:hypothetical protein
MQQTIRQKGASLLKMDCIEFYGNNINDLIDVPRNDDHYDLIYASKNERQFLEMNTILGKLRI